MIKQQTKTAEELDFGDYIAGYRHPLREVILTKTAVQCVTELGDVIKFSRGDTVELGSPWPQGLLVGYLYDWQTGIVGSDYKQDIGTYNRYLALNGYHFEPGDNLGDYGAGTIAPARELNELAEAYKNGGYEEVADAARNLLSVMGMLN